MNARQHIAEAERLLAESLDRPAVLADRGIARAQVHAHLANAQLQVERLDRAAAAEQLLADLKPSPRSLDPRHNQKNGTRRRTDREPPTAATDEGSR